MPSIATAFRFGSFMSNQARPGGDDRRIELGAIDRDGAVGFGEELGGGAGSQSTRR